jgi:hypothetical protein
MGFKYYLYRCGPWRPFFSKKGWCGIGVIAVSAGFPFGADGSAGIGVTLICIADMSLSMRKAMSRRESKSAERIGEKVSDGSRVGASTSPKAHRSRLFCTQRIKASQLSRSAPNRKYFFSLRHQFLQKCSLQAHRSSSTVFERHT